MHRLVIPEEALAELVGVTGQGRVYTVMREPRSGGGTNFVFCVDTRTDKGYDNHQTLRADRLKMGLCANCGSNAKDHVDFTQVSGYVCETSRVPLPSAPSERVDARPEHVGW